MEALQVPEATQHFLNRNGVLREDSREQVEDTDV